MGEGLGESRHLLPSLPEGLSFLGQPMAVALRVEQQVTGLLITLGPFVLLCPSSPAALGPPLRDPALPGHWTGA